MKKFLEVLFAILIVGGAICYAGYLIFSSVDEAIDESKNTSNYSVFIEDAVRYTLACADPKYAYMDFDNTELQSKTDSKIEEIASDIDEDKPSYKIALEQLSKNGSSFEKQYASGLLKIYNNLKINLTPFEKDNEASVKFQETNSRVHFTATLGLLCYCSADSWDLGRYTKYLETGVFEKAPGEESESNNASDSELTEDRIKWLSKQGPARFDTEFDKSAFTEEFAEYLVKRVEEDIRNNNIESEEDYVYEDYFEMWPTGNGGIESYELESYKIVSQTEDEAVITLHGVCPQYEDETQDHTMYVKKKSGKWVISGWDEHKP